MASEMAVENGRQALTFEMTKKLEEAARKALCWAYLPQF